MERFTVGLPEEDYQKLEKKSEEKRIPTAVLARSMLVEQLSE